MSIQKNDGFNTFDIICDICGEETNKGFDSFSDAVAFKKDKSNGWKSRKVKDEWEDICPDCH
jgi:hypothetical protein